MKLMLSTNSKWRRCLVRGVAIFFVLFAFADIFFPEYCRESVDRLPVGSSALLSAEGQALDLLATDTTSDDSRREQPSDQVPHEGDCLGCCGHVLPNMDFVRVTIPEIKSPPIPLKSVPLLSPPLRGPFRPPRLA